LVRLLWCVQLLLLLYPDHQFDSLESTYPLYSSQLQAKPGSSALSLRVGMMDTWRQQQQQQQRRQCVTKRTCAGLLLHVARQHTL
jgi:hypothetical protein